MEKQKVLVAMSGGVDSSVAALLMKKRGFEVIGIFMKNWSDSKNELGECSWKDERRMAIKICSRLGIPLLNVDSEKQYRKEVIEKMFSDYKKGITPNPDIDCNKKIKFPVLLKIAKKIGARYLVTGHYARIKRAKFVASKSASPDFSADIKNDNMKNKRTILKRNFGFAVSTSLSAGRASDFVKDKFYQSKPSRGREWGGTNYELLRAKDESKDQSYFLYTLNQEELKNILFPIGDYTKKEIRKIAKRNNLENWSKKSTVGICFVGKVNLKKFLQKKIKPKKGKILDPEGKIIGEHDGIYYYTIGQRIGPRYGIDFKKNDEDKSFIKRWYVAKKDARKNILILAPEGHPLNYRKEIFVKNPHWINDKPKNGMNILVRIRQVGELLSARFLSGGLAGRKIKIILDKPITGVSEGQAIVLYDGKKVLGGGEIRFG